MRALTVNGVTHHIAETGPKDGPALVFANSLGTDLRLWDQVVPLLPKELRIIRYDKRGHGLSALPKPPYSMGALVRDAEALLDAINVKESLFVGLSIGGMIAQGLAAKRPDLIRAMVLSNTGAKIATREIWDERIAWLRRAGLEDMAEGILGRWFSRAFHKTEEIQLWRAMLVRTPADGYAGCAAAISGTDFYSSTAALRLPVLGIAGDEDDSTPPDLVRETTDLVPGSQFALIRGAGHLPCVEKPEEYARLLCDFIAATGHLKG